MKGKQQPHEKAWHVIDEEKALYFLVTVLKKSIKDARVFISYNDEKIWVNQRQLLPYQSSKSNNVNKLVNINEPELMDWINHSANAQQFWIKITSRLAIDFGKNSKAKRDEYITFIFNRFIVSERKKQYLFVSNDGTRKDSKSVVAESIFNSIKSIPNLWLYNISLDQISNFHSVMFKDLPIKFKIYFKDNEIIKMSILPYRCMGKELLGQEASENILNFRQRIFNILANSNEQIKRYYRIPKRFLPQQAETETVNSFVDCLLNINLKVNQIDEIIQTFAIIMNINEIQMIKFKVQAGYYFKIKSNSVIRQNLQYLMGQRLLGQFESDLNRFKREEDLTIKNIRIKQAILMKLIWQELTFRLADIFNDKMVNLSKQFQNYRQLVYIQFPFDTKHSQATPQSYMINIINSQIKKIAFNNKFHDKTYNFDANTIYENTKQDYIFDFNKQILDQTKKTVMWQKEMKKCHFFMGLKQKKVKKNDNSIDSLKQKQNIQNAYFQMSQLKKKDKDLYLNFIIQTSLTSKNAPDKSLIAELLKSVESTRKKQNEKSLQESNQDGQDNQDSQEQQEYNFIEMSFETFNNRYAYSRLIKQLSKSQQGLKKQLQAYFTNKPENGQLKPRKGKQIILSIPFYKQMEQQRSETVNKLSKIQRQFKKIQSKLRTFKKLKELNKIIQITKVLQKRTLPIKKWAFMKLKKRNAVLGIGQIITKCMASIKKESIKMIKKQILFSTIIRILYKKTTIKNLKKQFFLKMKAINKLKLHKKASIKLNNIIFTIIQRKQQQALFSMKKHYTIVILPPPKSPPLPLPLSPSHIPSHSPSSITSTKIAQMQLLKNQKDNSKNIISNNIAFDQNNNNNPQQNIINNQTSFNQNKFKESPSLSIHEKQKQQQSDYSYKSVDEHPSDISNKLQQKDLIATNITRDELCKLKDISSFTLQIWMKQAVGFQRRKPKPSQNKDPIKSLFYKTDTKRPVNKQQIQQLDVDIFIKEKIVINPFFPYIMDYIQATSQHQMQNIMSHQQSKISQPLIKIYPTIKYPQVAQNCFNNLLKIGRDKNTSKSLHQLINSIVRPIKQSYHSQRKNVSTVFEGEPVIIADYSWDHNIVKDQIFLQFVKQIMLNQRQQSLLLLSSALEIITRYYYPSPQFMYSFLHFLKSLANKNVQKINNCFINILLFAQAYQKFKGNNVTALKDETAPKQKQSYNMLEPRLTDISQRQLQNISTVTINLLNQESYEFRVRNQTFEHFKRKVLKLISFLQYQEYFGIYFVNKLGSTHLLMHEDKKVIDFLTSHPQSLTQNILYVKLKYYFPFHIKQINIARLVYLNSIFQEKIFPWKAQQYEYVGGLSFLFEQFEQIRIGIYLMITNQPDPKIANVSKFKDRLSHLIARQKNERLINQYEYFKIVKQSGFLFAKAYIIKESSLQSPLFNISRVIIKPLQLCFYQQTQLKSSISLKRIKSHMFDKGQIQLQILYGQEDQISRKIMTLRQIERIKELYFDISAYIEYLMDK